MSKNTEMPTEEAEEGASLEAGAGSAGEPEAASKQKPLSETETQLRDFHGDIPVAKAFFATMSSDEFKKGKKITPLH